MLNEAAPDSTRPAEPDQPTEVAAEPLGARAPAAGAAARESPSPSPPRGGSAAQATPTAARPVEGLHVDVAGQGKDGFRVVDVWESEEAFNRFGEKLMPILKELGIEAEPEVYPAKAFVSA